MKTDSQRKSLHRPKGFTLTEVMVVIVIVAVLASISFFVTKRAMASANKATITNNMRQLSLAILSNVSDEGKFFDRSKDPRWDRWILPALGAGELPENRDALNTENASDLASLAEMFQAPDDKPKDLEKGSYKCSYGVTAWLSNANGFPYGQETKDLGVRMARIRKPSKWCMMYQNYKSDNLLGKGFNSYTQEGTGVNTPSMFISFVDGHVESVPNNLTRDELRERYWPTRND
ncbi:prepilin-type N-terminal cleavage/methylation domain-containing protein [Haloferula chungangensis]|uniref:Prepilin-type N-terminal cleavage/methylation domain-containing protein n=1 Tax=Haloferula chungangensis TaxID=1048331 RepID=A0ABW2L412_9BACT